MTVGIKAHDPSADRAHHEADGEDGCGIEKLCGLIACGKEVRCEVKCKGGVDIPVEPFDEIARRAADNRFQAMLAVRRLRGSSLGDSISGLDQHTQTLPWSSFTKTPSAFFQAGPRS